jgi:hypothetical protein
MELMLRFCDSRAAASDFSATALAKVESPAEDLEQFRAFFSRHLLWWRRGHRIREIGSSVRSSIHRSPRVVLNRLSRSEETASGHGKR